MIPPELDRNLGMLSYLTSSPRIEGKLREKLSDFIVDEVLKGYRASRVFLGLTPFQFSPGAYLYIVVVKFSAIDTNNVSRVISRRLGGRVRFAGLKDARAVVFQFFSVEGHYKAKVIETNGIRAVPIGRGREPISRGSNDGNYFTIVVRGVDNVPPLEKFPNFFSYQRFGVRRPFNHEIGKLLLLRDLEGAKSMIQMQGYDIGYAKSLREIASILGINRLRFYINSYQSYLFNILLSKRLEEGISLRKGDFILKGGEISLYPNEGHLLLPLIGAFTREKPGWLMDKVNEVLREEGVEKDMFIFKELPEISALGGFRRAIEKVSSLKVVRGDDRVVLSFYLRSGTYATSYLRELIKPTDPVRQGFI